MWLSCLWFSFLPQEVFLQVPRFPPPLKNRKKLKIKRTAVVDEEPLCVDVLPLNRYLFVIFYLS